MDIWNNGGLKTSLFLILGVLFFITNAIAQEGASATPKTQEQVFVLQKLLRQITTHPEMDMSAVLSPDGKWIAFTSRRSGNLDIWVKPVKGGRSVPITTHKADDYQPTWSPDGKKVAFVSQREDAAGDIWVQELKIAQGTILVQGKPQKIAPYLGLDNYPAFSPDGKEIAFASTRDGQVPIPSGQENLWIYDLKKKTLRQLTSEGGTHPAWAPDGQKIAFTSFRGDLKNGGDIYVINTKEKPDLPPSPDKAIPITSGPWLDGFPYWAPSGDRLVFTRYAMDDNRDGLITPEDRPSLWTVTFQSSMAHPETLAVPITPGGHSNWMPYWAKDDRIYFTSDRSGNWDIWSLPAEGWIPRLEHGAQQLQLAREKFPFPEPGVFYGARPIRDDRGRPIDEKDVPEWLYSRLLALQKVKDYFPEDSLAVAWAYYESGRTYLALHYPTLATYQFDRVLNEYATQREVCAFAEMARIVSRAAELGISSGGTDERSRGQDRQEIATELQLYQRCLEKYPDQRGPCARSQIIIGDLWQQLGEKARALWAYESVLNNYPEITSCCAEAQLKMGDVFLSFGQETEVVEAYLKVLARYPNESYWVEQAITKILALGESSDDPVTLISNYRQIIENYPDYPELAATAQLRIAQVLRKKLLDYPAALQELEVLKTKYSVPRKQLCLAELEMAQTHLEMEEDLKAFNCYQKVIDEYSDVENGLYREQARQELVTTLLESGQRLSRTGDLPLALSRYKRAREVQPDNIEAHRGYIFCMYRSRLVNPSLNIDRAIAEYVKLVSQNPDNEVALYILGLCYSYKATEEEELLKKPGTVKVGLVKKSMAIIDEALSQNYRLIPAYLTQSFNFQIMERYETWQRMRPKPLWRRVGGTILTPLTYVFRTLTFQKEKSPQRWYENAIDVLTTAIALNDEAKAPQLEAALALNLAENYYNLGEFGYPKAYEYYQYKLTNDSTFIDKRQEALVYSQMGHCALVVEDFINGPRYLKRAIRLYEELGESELVLLNIKRLALLYQLGGEYEEAIDYFKKALEIQQRRPDSEDIKSGELEKLHRSIAYNYQLLEDEEEAIRHAQKAAQYLTSGKLRQVKTRGNWLKLGFLGVYIPIWNLGPLGAGQSTAAEGFTTQEELALVYSIIGEGYASQRDYLNAITYLEKKLALYRKEKNKRAEAIILNQTGYFYLLIGDYARAWTYFEQALNICEKEKFYAGALLNISNLASLAVILGNLDEAQKAQLMGGQLPVPIGAGKPLIDFNPLEPALNYLQKGLAYYEKKDLLLPNKERITLLNLMGTLYFLKGLALTNQDTSKTLEGYSEFWLRALEEFVQADSCYRQALQMAREYDFKKETAALYQNIGLIQASVGDWEAAYQSFDQARQLALKEGYPEILWRADHALGNLLSNIAPSDSARWKASRDLNPMKFSEELTISHLSSSIIHPQDPMKFYEEAIEVVETNLLLEEKSLSTWLDNQETRVLYQDAIRYLIQQGELQQALYLTESLRARTFLGQLAGRRLILKKERHKLYWGNAHFLQREIDGLEARIRQARSRGIKTAEPEILTWQQQLAEYRKEYVQLLAQMKQEDPELESLVRVNPPSPVEIQRMLPPATTVLSYLVGENETFVWIMTNQHLRLQTLPVTNQELRGLVDKFWSQIHSEPTGELSAARELYQLLLEPTIDVPLQSEQVRELIIVPDDFLVTLPFGYLLEFSGASSLSRVELEESPIVVPSLSSYYYCFLKRKISGGTVYLAGNTNLEQPLADLSYSFQDLLAPEQSQTRAGGDGASKTDQRIWQGDILHLPAQIAWNEVDPLRTSVNLGRDSAHSFSFRVANLLSWDLRANLVILEPAELDSQLMVHSNSLICLERALFYAGTPTVLLSLWPVEENIKTEFFRYFYRYLQELPPSMALTKAQKDLQAKYPEPRHWAGFQLLGYGGMTKAEEKQFAQQSFVGRVMLGHRAYEEKEWSDAIRYYEEALVMAQTREDEESVSKLQNLIIEVADNGGLFNKAIEYQLNLLEKARQAGDVQAMAESYNNLVVFYTESQDFSNAVTFQQKYLELAEQYHLRGEEARSYNSLGLVYEHGGNFQKALEAYRRSLELYQELGETQGMAINLRDMGRIYLTRYDNYSAALEYQTKALELFQEEGDDANTIDALQNLGLTYEKLANYRQALEYQSRALSLSQEIQDTTRIGLSYQYLANLSWKTGDYQTALKYQRQALDIFEKQQAAKLQLIGLATEGLIYMSLGRLEDGLKAELRALEIAEKINERLDQATIHKNIGLMYSAASQLEKALASFQKATQIDEALGSKRGLAYDYRDLGSLFLRLNRVAEAKTHLTKALRLSTEIGDGRNEAQCLYELGRAYHSLGNVDSSLQCLQEAVQKASYLLIPEVEWRAYRYLAKIQEEKGKLSQSLESLQKAVEVIEAMRSRIKVEEYKSGFIDDKLEVYGDLVLLLLKMGRTGEAFEAAERAKSRNFIDMLANREISFKGQASTEMLAQGDSLKTAMGNLQVEISILRGKGTDITVPETEKLAQLEKELQRLKSRYENYLIQLKEANRELAGLVSVDPWSLEQVQQILPQEAAILEYFLTNNEVILWTITAEKVQATTSKIPLMELGELVQNFRKGIERRLSIENLSRTLYKILAEPARKSLEDIHHLVIIPHGILHYLPFAALMDGNNRYLVEDFNLSLAPSATVLGFCLEKGQSFVARPDWEKKVLALGNPDLGNPALALPFATQEISSLQITYPQVQSYLEKAATEETFKTQSPQANLILLSCHGEYDATNPLFSALLLTPTAEDDGRLEAHEIFGLNLNAYLIAMSACETGLGTITGGDEVIGLSRSFIFAGASSLMASLWKVDDLATAVLVKRFFRYLKQGQSRSEALRNAQMLVKNEINAHPAFWAAFTLTGDFR